MKEYIKKLKKKIDLTSEEIQDVMKEIMSGKAALEDMEQFLLALRHKGVTITEITGAAQIMREFSIKVKTKHETVLDTCGTGGDKIGTFNISTIATLVVAGAGVAVAKHGNRSVSSQCGSADVLEALGVNLDLSPEKLGECLDEIGLAFLFAQRLHPAMKYVAPARKKLGVETIFNILGPLTNPAGATHQMIGVYDKDLVRPIAEVLKNLGLKKAIVVHGHDGLDEITTTGATFISEFNGEEVISYPFSPEEFHMKISDPQELKGGDIDMNLEITQSLLRGHRGPKRDIVVLNAACALYIAEAAKSIEEGIKMASESLDLGKAYQKLENLKEFTNSV